MTGNESGISKSILLIILGTVSIIIITIIIFEIELNECLVLIRGLPQ